MIPGSTYAWRRTRTNAYAVLRTSVYTYVYLRIRSCVYVRVHMCIRPPGSQGAHYARGALDPS